MRPISLKGHERAITQVKLNRDGDLIFSCAKDNTPSVWYSENGERLGSYQGHNGVVWALDVSYDTNLIVTGSGDNKCMLWDCETGDVLSKLQAPTSVRTVGFSYNANLFFYTTDQQMKQACTINIYDTRDGCKVEFEKPQMTITVDKSKVTSALWSHLNDTIITGHENGNLCQFDIRAGCSDPVNFAYDHSKLISDMQISEDQTMLITASKDHTSCLFDAQRLDKIKTFKSERPVNSAAMSPTHEHIILGGGEDAMSVTQTAASMGQFEAKLYHMVYEDEFARIKGHFGPINSLRYHPDGKGYVSGAEDGFLRVHRFDPDYFNFKFDV